MNNFIENNYNWVNWITVIDSWKKWQNIWIFAITHWNEPVWLKVFDYLINSFNIESQLLKWKIYLVAINVEAYKKYISQNDFLEYRFINNNMNRIYGKEFVKWSIEFERFLDLKNVFDEIDIAIDLHSVASWNDIIWITDEKFLSESKWFFDVETILVDDVSKSWAMIWYFIDKWKIAFWLECWNHIWENACNNWVNNVLNFLSYFWFIDLSIKKEIDRKWIFRFVKEIFPRSIDFHYLEKYKNFTKIDLWENFAKDWENYYFNDFNKEVYLWLLGKKVKVWDWNWFIFEKIS